MDFLDPQKQKAHGSRLIIGYILMGIAVLLAAMVLLYVSKGFWIDRHGKVIQNGLIFLSSQPSGANIFVDGTLKDTTNTRLQLASGSYDVEIQRDGYRSWKRGITVQGGVVERFDYPFLFPTKLTTATTKQYSAAPLLYTQSTDRRWLIVQTISPDQFDLYDLSADKPAPKPLVVPADVLVPATTTTGWEATAWADDNRHVILKRTYQTSLNQPGVQYILFDRNDAAASQNLTELFGFSPTSIAFSGGHFDQYYLFDQASAQIFKATIKKPTPEPYLSNVLAYVARQDRLLYITNKNTPQGKVQVRINRGDKTYNLRQLPADANYLLNMATYNGDWFMAIGAPTDGKLYIYRNPEDVLSGGPQAVAIPVQVLKLNTPTYLSFSTNSRFIAVENASRFAVYDAETAKAYVYQIKATLDGTGPAHAAWMDGYHLEVMSQGKLTVFDFDGTNSETLMAVNPAYPAAFSTNYKTVYTLNAQNALSNTALVLP